MSNLTIENLSYDMKLDREAMQATHGGLLGISFGSLLAAGIGWGIRNPGKVVSGAKKTWKWLKSLF